MAMRSPHANRPSSSFRRFDERRFFVGVRRALIGRRATTYPFDAIQKTLAAYALVGFRRLLTTYRGSAFTARRSSDNAQQTFSVDTLSSAVASWRDTLGACDAYLVQWFDQSGNGRHPAVAVTSLQPLIDLQSKYPELMGDGVDDVENWTAAAGFANNQAGITIGISAKMDAIGASSSNFIGFTAGTGAANTLRAGIGASATTFRASGRRADADSTAVATGPSLDLLWHSLITTFDFFNRPIVLYTDGAASTAANFAAGNSNSAASNSTAGILNGTTASPVKGRLSCIALYQSVLSAGNIVLLNAAITAVMTNPAVTQAALQLRDVYVNRVYQRAAGGTTRSINFKGYYTGTAPTFVKVRVLDYDTAAEVVALTTIDSAPANGRFSGNITVPQGAHKDTRYRVEISDSKGNTVLGNNPFQVGMLLFPWGQSNTAKLWQTPSGSPPALTSGAWRFNGKGYFAANAVQQAVETGFYHNDDLLGGDGLTTIANRLLAVLDIPICFVPAAIGGTNILSWSDSAAGTSWLNYTAMTGGDMIDTDLEYAFGRIGEEDSIEGTSKSSFKSRLATFEANLRARSRATMKFVVCPIRGYEASGSEQACQDMRQGGFEHADANTSTYVRLGDSIIDQYPNGTGALVHFTPPQYVIDGHRIAETILYDLGAVANPGTGPTCGTATAAIGGRTIRLAVTHNGGTALRDASGGTTGVGVTGFKITLNGSNVAVASTAFPDGTHIDVTYSSGSPVLAGGETLLIDHQFGHSDTTNPIYDNNPLPNDSLPGRPLQPSRGSITVTVL